MGALRNLSGRELIKALSKAGFRPVRQRGSHVTLVKESSDGKIGCTVPMHDELKAGTIRGILKQAQLSADELLELL